MSLRKVREEIKQKEEDERKKEEQAWILQEEKAKEEEQRRRSSVSLARKEVAREREEAKRWSTILVEKGMVSAPGERRQTWSIKPQRPPPPIPPRPGDKTSEAPPRPPPPGTSPMRPRRSVKPKNRKNVIDWFQQEELSKRICYDGDKILPYFHGIISRQDAENLLVNKPPGSFLVRVSERVWGYTITYRAPERCKHYLVDTSENTYQFFGHNQIAHQTLKELIEFHKMRPISGLGQELLKIPCGQECDPPDYQELITSVESEESFSTKL